MSASREKRARQGLGADYLSPKDQKAREEAKSAQRTTIIFTICAVAFLIAVIAMALNQSGILQRGAAAVRVGDQTYTAADVAYYYNSTRLNLQNSGLVDSQTSLRKQDYTDGKTWYDYVSESAANALARTTVLSQAAKNADFNGSENYEQNVSDILASVQNAAKSNNLSYAQYLKALFGSLMTPAAFERNLRAEELVAEYTDSVSAVENFTDDELNAVRDAAPADYDVVAVRHILVEDEATANDILARWEAGEKTEDSFAALVADNSTDPGSKDNGGLYENVHQGQMVTAFNDWCFDDARVAGDTGIVQTDYGYHVMYFVSRQLDPDWKTTVAASLASEKLAALYADVTPELLDGMKYIDK